MSWLWQIGGALACIALSFGINTFAKVDFQVRYGADEYAKTAGTLTLSPRNAGALELPLMTTHIVTRDLERMRRVYRVRELGLRAAGSGEATRLELFADLSGFAGDLAGGNHDPNVLVQTELPVLRRGRLGARPSFVMLDGARPSNVLTGSLLITTLLQEDEGGQIYYRAEGRLELQLETEHGVELVTGRWSGRLEWDPTPTGA
jgi:hypothetical protein